MEKAALQLKNNIMRRVYYVYGLRLLASPVTTHGLVLALSLFFMSYFVSFKHVYLNLMQVPLGQVATYLLQSLLKTEIWTLLFLGIAILSVLSLRFRLHFPSMLHA